MAKNVSESTERDTIIVEDDVLRDGFTQVPNILLRTTKLTHGAKLAYALLLSYAWGRDRCFPGQERLGADLGVERKAVIRYLKELKDKGVIRVERRGLGRTNLYILPKLADVPILGHQDVPSTTLPDDPPMGLQEDSIKNKENTNSISKNRKIETSGSQLDTANSVERDPPSQTRSRHASGFQSTGSILSGQPNARPIYNEDRDRILAYLQDISRLLNDQAPLKSSVTRAYGLYQRSGKPIEVFCEALYQARAITQERSASIRGQASTANGGLARKAKMAYFFSVLEDLLGMKPSDHETTYPNG